MYGIEICLILFLIILIVLPLLLYEFKDQSLVQQMYMIILLLPVEFSTIPGHLRQ